MHEENYQFYKQSDTDEGITEKIISRSRESFEVLKTQKYIVDADSYEGILFAKDGTSIYIFDPSSPIPIRVPVNGKALCFDNVANKSCYDIFYLTDDNVTVDSVVDRRFKGRKNFVCHNKEQPIMLAASKSFLVFIDGDRNVEIISKDQLREKDFVSIYRARTFVFNEDDLFPKTEGVEDPGVEEDDRPIGEEITSISLEEDSKHIIVYLVGDSIKVKVTLNRQTYLKESVRYLKPFSDADVDAHCLKLMDKHDLAKKENRIPIYAKQDGKHLLTAFGDPEKPEEGVEYEIFSMQLGKLTKVCSFKADEQITFDKVIEDTEGKILLVDFYEEDGAKKARYCIVKDGLIVGDSDDHHLSMAQFGTLKSLKAVPFSFDSISIAQGMENEQKANENEELMAELSTKRDEEVLDVAKKPTASLASAMRDSEQEIDEEEGEEEASEDEEVTDKNQGEQAEEGEEAEADDKEEDQPEDLSDELNKDGDEDKEDDESAGTDGEVAVNL